MLDIQPVNAAMYFDIVPMRVRGKPREPRDLRNAQPVRGDVHMVQARETPLGRASTVAYLQNQHHDLDQLPRLYDAVIHGMASNGATITGIELVDGAAYAQSWWIRTPGPQ